jgi:hypothetical protein
VTKIPQEIKEALYERRCLFFIGSGMSAEAGLPSAKVLAQVLAEKLKTAGHEVSSQNLSDVAEDFRLKFGRTKLLETVRSEIVRDQAKVDRASFNLLAQLKAKPRNIVTTNWDSLIEKALGEEDYCPIFEPKLAGKTSDRQINLFKIHGDIDGDFVITRGDYREYGKHWEPMITKLKALFLEEMVVFIGYSTDDEDFLNMYMPLLTEPGPDYLPLRYSVSPYPNDVSRAKLNERKIRYLEMGARDFLIGLKNELVEAIPPSYTLPSPKTVPARKRKDFNPFSIFRAEDISEPNWTNETFVPPIEFAKIISPGNVIIEGHRGSGKSIILQYLSYPSQAEREEKDDYVGFYLKLQDTFVNTITKREMSIEEWKNFFSHYLSLLLGQSILITLKKLKEDKKIEIDHEEDFVRRVIFRFFPDLPKDLIGWITNIDSLCDLFSREQNNCATYPRPAIPRLSPHFVYDFLLLLQDYVNDWKGKFFYLLIDEYDKLDNDQQKVANVFLADRGSPITYKVTFKIGVKSFQMVHTTINDKMLDDPSDCEWVALDRFDDRVGDDFKTKLIDIAAMRLRYYKYDNEPVTKLARAHVAELFPAGKRGFENGDYSGLENMLTLSSYVVRDFLELAKDMLYLAYPWIVSEKKAKIPPVPPHLQNFVISVHSNILYTTRIDGIPGNVGDKERKNLARLLIQNLGVIFQRILAGSTMVDEKRTVSGFQLRNDLKLSQEARAALEDCRDIGVLQLPYVARATQNSARDAPHRKYEFHRLLCPRFNLSLGKRFPREINAEMFNGLVEPSSGAADRLTQYFIFNIFVEEASDSLRSSTEGKDIKDIMAKVRATPHKSVKLFDRPTRTRVDKTLTGWALKGDSDLIECSSEIEAKYLKLFADAGFKCTDLPLDSQIINECYQRLQTAKPGIERKLLEKIEDYPYLKKKAEATSQVWLHLVSEQ